MGLDIVIGKRNRRKNMRDRMALEIIKVIVTDIENGGKILHAIQDKFTCKCDCKCKEEKKNK